MYVVSSESDFGQALRGATEQTDPKFFFPLLIGMLSSCSLSDLLRSQRWRCWRTKTPRLLFLMRWAKGRKLTLSVTSLLFTTARRKGQCGSICWLVISPGRQKNAALTTRLTPCNKSAIVVAYAYLASLEPTYGAEPIMYNGKELLTQMEWFNRFAFEGDDNMSQPQ